jgi:hypothetical protein
VSGVPEFRRNAFCFTTADDSTACSGTEKKPTALIRRRFNFLDISNVLCLHFIHSIELDQFLSRSMYALRSLYVVAVYLREIRKQRAEGCPQGCSNIRKIRIRIRIREYSTNSNFRNWPKIRRIEFEFEFKFCFGNEFEYESNSLQCRIFANIRSEFVYDKGSNIRVLIVCHDRVLEISPRLQD